MSIRTLIVDDEPLARLNLSSLLEHETDVELVGECGDAETALRSIQTARPQLVFLDIQMPGMSGFDLLDRWPGAERPALVFVTAHEQFALRAFEACALDYLLKPFRRERLHAALDRVRERLQPVPAVQAPERMLVKAGGRYVLVRLAELDFVRAAANYVTLHSGAGSLTVRETLAEFHQRLPAARFLRVHRSYIVNVDALQSLDPAGGGEYVARLRNGRELPVGPSHLESLRRHLGPSPASGFGAGRLA